MLCRSQHFGYYDQAHQDEASAQVNYHQQFAKLLELTPVMKVLDAGCGQGVVACYLSKHHDVHVTGVTVVAAYVKDHAAIHGIYQFGPGHFPANLLTVGFQDVTEADWTKHLMPSFERLRRLGRPLSAITRPLGLEKRFVNVMSSKMYADGVDRGAFRYKVYTATKP
jgi:hypothetical protein